jgi:hypothetical membrane protein
MARVQVGLLANNRRRLLLAAGIAGPILFFAVFTVAGAIRPGYSVLRDFVADLSLGDQGWVQIANFIVFGLLTLAFAAGVRSALRTGPAAIAGPLLIGTFGLGLVLAGLFLPDPGPKPSTVHGQVHGLVGLAGQVALALSGFVFARRFGGLRGFGAYAVATGLAILLVIVLDGVVGLRFGIAGLTQRLRWAVMCVWVVALAMRLLRTPP